MDARLYTPQEVSEIMHLPIKRTLQIMKNEMRCVKIGKRLRVRMEEIIRWQREQSMIHAPEQTMSLKERRRARTAQLEQYARTAQLMAATGGRIPYRK